MHKRSLMSSIYHLYTDESTALIFHIFCESYGQTDGNFTNKLWHFTCKGSTKGIADFMADKIMIMSYRSGLCGCRHVPVWAAQ